ncbi:MAG: ribonuclease P protein component [Puniceicoccales bacterium]|jgi:ribonuclease P protein component|nr:ribonuclease P protein component [Puniceicoccales bacterium]
MRLTAAQKLRAQADFVRARQQGLRLDCGPFLLNAFHVAGAETAARIGVVTGKKMLGDAVHRNRMRRVFREIFRLHPTTWPTGWDVVIVPRRSCLSRDHAALRQLFLESSARLLARKHPAPGDTGAPGARPSHV